MRVFTNGCFDILHRQHIVLLNYCRAKAGPEGIVIVGINSDESVKRLKGPSRPIFSEEDRKTMLLSLRSVNRVYIFHEDTPYQLIYKLDPDIIVKGSDWKDKEVVGWDLVPEGKVFFAPTDDSITTTKIIDKCYISQLQEGS